MEPSVHWSTSPHQRHWVRQVIAGVCNPDHVEIIGEGDHYRSDITQPMFFPYHVVAQGHHDESSKFTMHTGSHPRQHQHCGGGGSQNCACC